MFGCGVIVLQNMASSSNKFAVLCHWIPGSTNRHTITVAEKVYYNENKPRICIFNDSDNSSCESKQIRNR